MTIVIAYSPDDSGRAALAYGATEAELRGRGLVVVNATKGDALVDRRYAAESDVTGLDAELARLGIEHEVRQPMAPDVAEAVLEVVDDVDAELLVVGVRHRTAVGKLLLGSVAQRLILDAPCPVLAVKPEAGAAW